MIHWQDCKIHNQQSTIAGRPHPGDRSPVTRPLPLNDRTESVQTEFSCSPALNSYYRITKFIILRDNVKSGKPAGQGSAGTYHGEERYCNLIFYVEDLHGQIKSKSADQQQ